MSIQSSLVLSSPLLTPRRVSLSTLPPRIIPSPLCRRLSLKASANKTPNQSSWSYRWVTREAKIDDRPNWRKRFDDVLESSVPLVWRKRFGKVLKSTFSLLGKVAEVILLVVAGFFVMLAKTLEVWASKMPKFLFYYVIFQNIAMAMVFMAIFESE